MSQFDALEEAIEEAKNNLDIPDEWIITTFPESVFFQEGPGLRKFQYREEGVPFLNIRTLIDERVEHSLCKYLDPTEVEEKYQHFLLEDGDIVASSSGTLGKVAVITKEDLPLMLNTSIIRFRPYSHSEPLRGFIKWYLKSDHFLSQATKASTGSAQVNFGPSHLKKMYFLMPPLNEQRRIVEKIEALTARSRKARAALDEIPALLDQFRQSVLAAAFRGDLTADWRAQNPNVEPAEVLRERISHHFNQKKSTEKKRIERIKAEDWFFSLEEKLPEEWIEVDLVDVTWIITCGVAKRPNYVDQGIPFLSAQNAKPFKANLKDIRFISNEDYQKFTVGAKPEKDDVIYSRVGANFGEAAKVPFDFDFAIYVSLTLVKPIHDLIDPDFLVAFLNSCHGTIQARGGIMGSGIQNLNVESVRHYRIPVPSIEEQRETVRLLNMMFEKCDYFSSQYEEIVDTFKDIDQSILAKAFRGQLVPQDPNDEPAAVLLDRIRAERERLGSGKKRGKAKA